MCQLQVFNTNAGNDKNLTDEFDLDMISRSVLKEY